MNETNWSRLQAEKMKFNIVIKGKTIRDSVRNSEIRANLNAKCMKEWIIRWYGNLKRLGEEALQE